MGNTLYLECYSGISGDMSVAALLDLGADREVLLGVLESLPLHGYEIQIRRVKKSGIDACDFNVVLDAVHENHDHDMEYLHGHEKCSHRAHSHEMHGHGAHSHETHNHETHDPGENSREAHSHGAQGHHAGEPHVHRGLKEIREIINRGEMTDNARNIALRIFQILAEAEAKAHHVPVEQVHFHEVGAVDSIVDIVAAAVCLDNLDITEVIIPELWEGRGTVRCQHGILPVPVPAVSNILAESGLKIKITDVEGELVTPTGAAIAAAVQTSDCLPEGFSVQKIGIGAGKRQYECPGILRAMLISGNTKKQDVICKLETNIDDCTGEALGYVMERLFAAGARDVHYVPAFMKKNRPGWILCVLCREEEREKLEEIIFRETTTIGIRRTEMVRTVLERTQYTLKTPYGTAEVKVCSDGCRKYVYPEYESLAEICRKHGIPYPEAYQMVMEAAGKLPL